MPLYFRQCMSRTGRVLLSVTVTMLFMQKYICLNRWYLKPTNSYNGATVRDTILSTSNSEITADWKLFPFFMHFRLTLYEDWQNFLISLKIIWVFFVSYARMTVKQYTMFIIWFYSVLSIVWLISCRLTPNIVSCKLQHGIFPLY